MDNLLTPERIAAVLAFRSKLDRPFEARDLDGRPNLLRAARDFAIDSVGDKLPFLAEIAAVAATGNFLSNGQAKGVLNVLVARESRKPAAPAWNLKGLDEVANKVADRIVARREASALSLANVPDGRYRVTLADDTSIALRIAVDEWVTDKYGDGTRKLSLRTGGSDDGEREWTGVGVVRADGSLAYWKAASQNVKDAATVLAQGSADGQWLIFGLAFAQAGDHCFRCGRELDTRESLLVGYGPTCAANLGLPWGAKATPAAVLLAKGASAPESDAHDLDADDHVQPGDVADEHDLLDVAVVAGDRGPRVSLQEARARGYSRTYEEIFGDD